MFLGEPLIDGGKLKQKANGECPFEMKEENKLVHSVYFIWFKQGLTFSFPPFHQKQPEKMKKISHLKAPPRPSCLCLRLFV